MCTDLLKEDLPADFLSEDLLKEDLPADLL